MKQETRNGETVNGHQKAEENKPVRRIKGNGKDYYEPFFFLDWKSDPCLAKCSHAAKGLWIDMLVDMWTGETYELTDTPERFARAYRMSISEFVKLVSELDETGAADVQAVQAKRSKTLLLDSKQERQNDSIAVRCRRLYNKHELKQKRAEAGRKGGLITQANVKQNAQANVKQPSISNSTSNSRLSNSSSSKEFVLPEPEDVSVF